MKTSATWTYYDKFKNSVFLNLDKFTTPEKLNLLSNLNSFLGIYPEKWVMGILAGKKLKI